MTYKTILTPIGRELRNEQLDVAFSIARSQQAHLVGLFTARPMTLPPYVIAEAGPAGEHFRTNQQAALEQMEAQSRRRFSEAAARHSHSLVEWRGAAHAARGGIPTHARYADLLIAPQPAREADLSASEAQDRQDVLPLATGRPVMFVPYAGRFPEVGRNVLVAWDASREAARAVADALPFLEKAKNVRLCVFNPGPAHGEDPGADAGLYLARHGVKVTVTVRRNAADAIGELLLSEAADCGADLIVMGAYGHSRLREMMFGGVTRSILESMTVPVLMSH